MRRYFFHLVIGPVFIRDRDGVELADDAAARARALEDIDRVSKASTIKRQDPLACAVVVEDHEGPRLRVPFAEVPGVVPDT
ncbi:MAG TPA: hypothetical protein VF601_03820 [Beijerinckiaceae bacterium]